ncbi:MAG: DNA translocase FtsK, partial [Oscillospiraceae bacterium]|nr:DNA translocase FtsK [Oscillospiraceae bacterium]
DIPLGPPPEQSVYVPGPAFEINPFTVQPDASIEVLPPRPEPDKDKELVKSIFEEHEWGDRQQKEVFTDFSPEPQDYDLPLPEEPQQLPEPPTADIFEASVPIKKPRKKKTTYRVPPLSLLLSEDTPIGGDIKNELRENGEFLVKVLESYGVQTKVVDISRGPTVTRYELQPNAGVRLSRITNLEKEIALNLATAGVRIVAPIPNKAAIGIEVPNSHKRIVRISSVISSSEFRRSESPLTVALGRDISGNIMVTDITRMPHLLIAGTTGSGKSNCLHSMIISLMYKTSPDDLKFVFIDPKLVEFGVYDGMPHMLIPVVTDPRKASGALAWAVMEMLDRYKRFSEYKVRDISSYNRVIESIDISTLEEQEGKPIPERLPRIVIIIDELADLMLVAPREVEDSICRLAQMARAAGIHLIIATQRPSVDVITGIIKANISSRIALSVVSQVDSRTIIDSAGAENLLGQGDMLFLPLEYSKPVRIQGCYVSDEEIEKVVKTLKENAVIEYNEEVLEAIEREAAKEKGTAASNSSGMDDKDSMLDAAIELVVEAGQASTSFLQRRLKLGFSRAGRIMDEMEAMGIIGPPDGSKPRVVNLTMQQLRERQLKFDEIEG